MDSQWVDLKEIKGAKGHSKCKELCDFTPSLLAIPYNSAECEQILCIVKTDFRNELEWVTTLLSLVKP